MSIKKFNPHISTLVKSLEYIYHHSPCPMSNIPLCKSSGYNWLWGMRDQIGLVKIKRDPNDGRSHIVWLTPAGGRAMLLLQRIKACNDITCFKCGTEIKRFFQIPNKRWKKVTGKDSNEVICELCFKEMEER